MKKLQFCIAFLLAGLATGCQNSGDNNRGLEYETLTVNFQGVLSDAEWRAGSEIGIFSSCTRDEVEDVGMSAVSNAKYTALTPAGTSPFKAASEQDEMIAHDTDHNFRFYAYYPWSAEADGTSIDVAVPAVQSYANGVMGYSTFVAKKSVTSPVAPVQLEFENIFSRIDIYLPDDLLDEDGNSQIRSLRIEPAVPANFEGALAVSGTYDLETGLFSENTAARSASVGMDFGTGGLTLSGAYTPVPFVVAPFTIPEGGLNIVATDMSDVEKSVTVLDKPEDAGKVYAAGETLTQYITAENDGIIPVNFPVVFPIGVTESVRAFTTETQPRWIGEGIWTCPTQTQAHAQWVKVSDPSTQYTQSLRTTNSGEISSPEIRGVWTGDYLEFNLPVKKFAAGSSVNIKFPMYTRQGPVFWYIEYFDEGEWKCNKEPITCYDPNYTMEATYSLIRGGKIIDHNMTFVEAIPSGVLKIRLTCADGTIQAAADASVTVRTIPYTDATGYGAPFYLYLAGSEVRSVTISVN